MATSTLTLETALHMLEQQPLRIIAGGTDYYPALQEQQPDAEVLDVTRIQSLGNIVCTDSAWSIGAGVTYTQLVTADLPTLFDALKCAARDVGSIQIQNRATVVGNICNASPAADGVPPLLIMDAEIEIASCSATRRVPLASFITGVRVIDLAPGEMVTAIVIPRTDAMKNASLDQQPLTHFYKLGSRRYLVISIAMVAVRLAFDSDQRINSAAVAVGACSPVAVRLHELELELLGQSAHGDFTSVVKPSHLRPLSPIDDVRGSAAYRSEVVVEIIERALRQLVQDYQALLLT